MAHAVAKFLMSALFDRGLGLLAWMTRRRWTRGLAGPLLTGSGKLTNLLFRVRPQSTPAAIGHEWERTFSSRKIVRVTQVEGDTAFGEIHVQCPLRGSGDVHACWRLMAYDRAIAERAGAQFIVIASQAEAGRDHCRVALRAKHLSSTDLIAAHERVAAGQSTFVQAPS